jgi:chondroitin 4-sulfotransferase 11
MNHKLSLFAFIEQKKLQNPNIEEEMSKRLDHMQKVCHDLGLDQSGEDDLHQPDPWEYLINKEHHLVWCNIFKSGSSR